MKFSITQNCPHPFLTLSEHASRTQTRKLQSWRSLLFSQRSLSFSRSRSPARRPSSGHIMHYLRENNTRCPVAACPAKLKSNKVKDDPLLAADIDELRKTQNQNVTADVMDITEFEE